MWRRGEGKDCEKGGGDTGRTKLGKIERPCGSRSIQKREAERRESVREGGGDTGRKRARES